MNIVTFTLIAKGLLLFIILMALILFIRSFSQRKKEVEYKLPDLDKTVSNFNLKNKSLSITEVRNEDKSILKIGSQEDNSEMFSGVIDTMAKTLNTKYKEIKKLPEISEDNNPVSLGKLYGDEQFGGIMEEMDKHEELIRRV